ncbi:MAG: VPLPA-CTERM sorting domain-containing protein [Pseudomonadota bacterium]
MIKLSKLIVTSALSVFLAHSVQASTGALSYTGQVTQVNAPNWLLNSPSPNVPELIASAGDWTLDLNVFNYEQFNTRERVDGVNIYTQFTGTLINEGFGVRLNNALLGNIEGERFNMWQPNPDYDPAFDGVEIPNPDFDEMQEVSRRNPLTIPDPRGIPAFRGEIPVFGEGENILGELSLTFERGTITKIQYDISGDPLAGYGNRVRELVTDGVVGEDFAIDALGFMITGEWDVGPSVKNDIFMLVQRGEVDSTAYVTLSGTAPVPVPAAFWLMGSALVGLAGLRKRKAAQQ